ncbi:MAG: aspartate/glutamate racemase family protein [Flammeovirgaceae bacterium]
MRTSKVIGIAGGMGPKGGAMLFDYILKHTPANCDQEHLPVILMSFPAQIEDRTAFLEGSVAQNPAYDIAALIEKLTHAGAEVIGIPCNTSYTPRIFNVVQEECLRLKLDSVLLNMPLEVINYIEQQYSDTKRIGVLSTNGTYHAQMYKRYLEQKGFTAVVPDPEFQYEVVHPLIYDTDFGLKANTEKVTETAKEYIYQIQRYFRERDTELFILGCTELSMLHDFDMGAPCVDSTEVLAKALIRAATDLGEVMPLAEVRSTRG